MKEQLEARVAELEAEYQKGESQLQDLDQQRAALRETLLRISGAVQVLKEELQKLGGEAVAQDASENGLG
ncbi:MAG TPA: hypothetical protein DCR93_08285 [Cytophagales bacterium]|nr:hypothetical protein [Cytophagales bacterium]HAP59483.1 hypothetical protein [Cytophagales bacterium]